MSIYSGTPIEGKSVTFTKDYAVGYEQVELDIPNVLLNFVGRQPGHSNCIMSFNLGWSSTTHLQDVQEMMALNLRRIEVGC